MGWPLYKSKYKHAYKAFEALMKGDDIFKEANITVRTPTPSGPSTHSSTPFSSDGRHALTTFSDQ